MRKQGATIDKPIPIIVLEKKRLRFRWFYLTAYFFYIEEIIDNFLTSNQ